MSAESRTKQQLASHLANLMSSKDTNKSKKSTLDDNNFDIDSDVELEEVSVDSLILDLPEEE